MESVGNQIGDMFLSLIFLRRRGERSYLKTMQEEAYFH